MNPVRPPASGPQVRQRFGDYELDASTGELTRDGEPVPLPPQSARLLALLVEHSGRLVTRNEIRGHLWPENTHVEADLGINHAIRRIRMALDDVAAHPSYVETLPRRGYRFKAPVTSVAGPCRRDVEVTTVPTHPRSARWGHWLAATLFLVATARLAWLPPTESVDTTAIRRTPPLAARPDGLPFAGGLVPVTLALPIAADVPPQAYGRYLQGLSLLADLPANQMRREHKALRIELLARTCALLEAAVAEAEGFADAWAALAQARILTQLWLPNDTWGPAAETAAAHAVALDPGHAAGWASLAHVALAVRRDPARAERLSERALIASGGLSPYAHAARATVLAAAGETAAARREVARARRLDPLSWRLAYTQAQVTYLDGDWREARRLLELLRDAHPADPVLASMLVRGHVVHGDATAALAVARDHAQATVPGGDPPATLDAYWRHVETYLGDLAREHFVSAYWRALPLVGLGRHEEAARLLERDACAGGSDLRDVHSDPFYRQLAGIPAYERAIRCLGVARDPSPAIG